MSKFRLYGSLIVKTGVRDQLVEILNESARLFKNSDGCTYYNIGVSKYENNIVFVNAEWSNENYYKSSLSLDNMKTIIKRAKPLIFGLVLTRTNIVS